MKRLVVALLAAAGTARADVYDDHPAAASRGPGDMVVVARGADGALYERHTVPGAWSPWASIGGNTQSGPAVVAYGGALHVFAAVARTGTNLLDLAVRGVDNAIYHRAYVPGARLVGLGVARRESRQRAVAELPEPWRAVRPPWRRDLGQGVARRVGLDRLDGLGPGRARPRIHRVVFFVKRGPRSIDRRRPYVRRLVLDRPAGSTGRVYARAVYTRKGSKKVRRKTVSKRFVMCG